jgi:hypothetical protein
VLDNEFTVSKTWMWTYSKPLFHPAQMLWRTSHCKDWAVTTVSTFLIQFWPLLSSGFLCATRLFWGHFPVSNRNGHIASTGLFGE